MRALDTKAIAATIISILPAIENPPNHLATPEPNLENIPPILENTPPTLSTNGAKAPPTLEATPFSFATIVSSGSMPSNEPKIFGKNPKALANLIPNFLNAS